MIKKIIFAICFSLIIGCSSLGPKVPVMSESDLPSSSEANLVFSTGAFKTSLSFSTYFVLYREDTGKVVSRNFNLDYPFSSHFPSHHGHLYYLQLLPGKYCYKFASGNPYFTVTKNVNGCVTLESNEIAYAGEVFISGNHIEIRDMYDRDVLALSVGEMKIEKKIFDMK